MINEVRKLKITFLLKDEFDWIQCVDNNSSLADHNCPFQMQYRFCANEVYSFIYSENSESDLQQNHRRLIQYNEDCVTDNTEGWFVPRICHHFSFCTELDHQSILKQIKCVNIFATYLVVVAEQFLEARTLFKKLLSIVTEHKVTTEVGPRIISEWQFRLAFTYIYGLHDEQNYGIGKQHILHALKLLEFKMPQSSYELQFSLWMEGFRWFLNNLEMFSKSSVERPVSSKKTFASLNWREYELNLIVDRLERLEPVLLLLSVHIKHIEASLLEQIYVDLIIANISSKIHKKKIKKRARVLGGLALKLWFSGRTKLATFLVNRVAHMFEINDADPNTISVNTKFLAACGNWSQARIWARSGMAVSLNLGDLKNYEVCANLTTFMMIFNGLFKDSMELQCHLEVESRLNGDVSGQRAAQSGT
jgi:hypothetical protein